MARLAGLSTGTVSRVMNGNPKVNLEIRAEVLKAAKLLNHVPNPAARAQTTRKSKTVAEIIPTIEHSVYAKYVTAVEKTLSQNGYTLVLAISNADLAQELAAAGQLVATGAEAFILTGAEHSRDLIELLERRGMPVLLTSVYDKASEVPAIGYDNTALPSSVMNYLQRCGHRNIAIAHGPKHENDRTVARCKGVGLATSLQNLAPFFEVEISVEGGREAAKRVLQMTPRPTAILCLSDVLALGVVFHLQSVGLTIPDDISIMGFDNLDWSKDSHPSLTTIDLPASKMGEAAAQRVVDPLENGSPLKSALLPANIIVHNSVRSAGSSD